MADGQDLRIDGTGTVHPLSKRASQALRARAGDWRLFASPAEVVLAIRENEGGRSLRLAGEVRTPGALCDIVAIIAQGGWGGEFVVLEEAATRSIYFEGGNVVGVSTSAPRERLGEILWRMGAITREQIEEVVLAAQKSSKRFGEAAMDLEFIEPEELFRTMARQVQEVFSSAVHATLATYFLFDRFDASQIAWREPSSTGQLLIDAARRMDELRFFREKVANDACVPVPLASPGKKVPEDLAEVFEQCDGRRSVAEIGRRTGQLEFEVTRGVFQLAAAGFVSVAPPRPDGPAEIVLAFNRALVEIAAACDAAGKGRELRAGVDQFATGTGIYAPLFSGAGPLADGSLEAGGVARNVASLSAEEDTDAWLTQQLFEYVGFALFHAGTLLPRQAEATLNASVTEKLRLLRR